MRELAYLNLKGIMQSYTILMSNLGYARGINGCLAHHVMYAHRHFYCSPKAQEKSLQLVNALIKQEDPDICCFVEIDKGSPSSANLNQLERLLTEHYPHFDIENKYGLASRFRKLSFTRGKSNAFMAKHAFEYEKIYFDHGIKRLIYKIRLGHNVTLFFAHFSLKENIRKLQLLQVKELIHQTRGEVIFMGDFNILTGLQEVAALLHDNHMVLLNREDEPTFTLHRRRLLLDLCFCSKSLAQKAELRVVPQPYSDHAALVLKMHLP